MAKKWKTKNKVAAPETKAPVGAVTTGNAPSVKSPVGAVTTGNAPLVKSPVGAVTTDNASGLIPVTSIGVPPKGE